VTGTVAMLNSSIPSAVIGFHRPSGVVKALRTSFQRQRCSVLSQRITRHQAKLASAVAGHVCLVALAWLVTFSGRC
jgi:hypothetical protein